MEVVSRRLGRCLLELQMPRCARDDNCLEGRDDKVEGRGDKRLESLRNEELQIPRCARDDKVEGRDDKIEGRDEKFQRSFSPGSEGVTTKRTGVTCLPTLLSLPLLPRDES